jgi:hypothetical protein
MASVSSQEQPSEVRVGDLRPLDMSAHRQPRPDIQRLSDEELLESVRKPTFDDKIVINTRSGTLYDGNGRAFELFRRASDEKSKITADMTVPVEYYTPDLSMFPDIM